MTIYFADTADLGALKKLIDLGLVEGCTTNPGIMAKAGVPYSREAINNIISVVNGPVSVELTTEDPDEMLRQAREYHSWNKEHVVVKVPIQNTKGECQTGLVKILEKEGIPVNVTCCMNLPQMVAASLAGATYASIFWGRVSDQGYDPVSVVNDIVAAYKASMTHTQIIIGSVRQVCDVTQAVKTGAHIITVTPDVLLKSLHHPRSVETQAEFLAAYDKMVQAIK